MPAEWEPQEAVWLSWPHRRSTWPGQFREVPKAFAALVAAISQHEIVRVICANHLKPSARKWCHAAGMNLLRVAFYPYLTNDAWCRDYGPIFVRHDASGEVAITDWRFNTWGGKNPPFNLDNAIPRKIAVALEKRRFVNPMILEGGSIEVNGCGQLLTSEQCLLNPNRNPLMSRAEIERELREFLGVQQVLWLGEGIAGDDTDGHVDDMARFYKPDGIVACVEPNGRDANHRPLAENMERLQSFRTPTGKKFEIVPLPMPRPFGFQGQRVPASYANFLIVNGAVFVPVFRQPRRDAEACAILRDCFPGREIVPIDCYHLVWGLGTLHCLSQQQPA